MILNIVVVDIILDHVYHQKEENTSFISAQISQNSFHRLLGKAFPTPTFYLIKFVLKVAESKKREVDVTRAREISPTVFA